MLLSNGHKSHVRNLSVWIFLLREANCTQNTKRYIKNMKKTWPTAQMLHGMIPDWKNMLVDDEKCETYMGLQYIFIAARIKSRRYKIAYLSAFFSTRYRCCAKMKYSILHRVPSWEFRRVRGRQGRISFRRAHNSLTLFQDGDRKSEFVLRP